jgi:poly(A) polymerase
MSSQTPRQWGVTPPISAALPTEPEIAANNALLEELKRQNNFESKAESDKRYVRPSLGLFRNLS